MVNDDDDDDDYAVAENVAKFCCVLKKYELVGTGLGFVSDSEERKEKENCDLR